MGSVLITSSAVVAHGAVAAVARSQPPTKSHCKAHFGSLSLSPPNRIATEPALAKKFLLPQQPRTKIRQSGRRGRLSTNERSQGGAQGGAHAGGNQGQSRLQRTRLAQRAFDCRLHFTAYLIADPTTSKRRQSRGARCGRVDAAARGARPSRCARALRRDAAVARRLHRACLSSSSGFALRRLSSRSSRMFWRDLASLSSLSPSLPQNTSFPQTPIFYAMMIPRYASRWMMRRRLLFARETAGSLIDRT